MVGPGTHTHSTRANLHLSNDSMMLLRKSLSPATRSAYARSWNLLIKYHQSHVHSFVLSVPTIILANFIGHLYSSGSSPSSIASHCSAFSFVHKLLCSSDPCQGFLIKKMIKGSKLSATHLSSDSRLPITYAILKKLVPSLRVTVPDADARLLLSALFLIA